MKGRESKSKGKCLRFTILSLTRMGHQRLSVIGEEVAWLSYVSERSHRKESFIGRAKMLS